MVSGWLHSYNIDMILEKRHVESPEGWLGDSLVVAGGHNIEVSIYTCISTQSIYSASLPVQEHKLHYHDLDVSVEPRGLVTALF